LGKNRDFAGNRKNKIFQLNLRSIISKNVTCNFYIVGYFEVPIGLLWVLHIASDSGAFFGISPGILSETLWLVN
jgi:hypothetical protein